MKTMKKTTAAALVALLLAGGGALAMRSSSSEAHGNAKTEAASAAKESGGTTGGATTKSAPAARDLHLGKQVTYEVKTTHTVGNADGAVATATTIGGRLALTVVGEADGGAAIRAELQSPSREDQPKAEEGAREALATPFFFVLRPDGAIASFGFPKSMPGDARRQLRSLVSSLQVVVGSGEAWESRESDGAGELVASYVRRGEHVEKTMARYETLRTAKGLVTPAAMGGTYVVTGGSRIDLDASGWPAALAEDVRVEATFQSVKLAMTSKATAKLVAQGEAKDLAGSYDAAKASFDADVDALAEGAALARRNADENLVGGASFRTLLAEIEAAKDGRGRAKTAARLGALFRTKPEAVAEARDVLLAKGTKESTAKALAAALGNGGTKEAQKALADAIHSNDTTPGTKSESAVSLGLVEKPTADARRALVDATKSSSSDVAETATLALGNLAKAASDAKDDSALGKGDPEDAVGVLLAKLAAAQTPAEKALALDALGNSGDPRAEDAILANVASPDPQIRAAAVGALRFLADERAAQAISTALFDAMPNVRMAALTAVANRSVLPFLDAMKNLFTHDEDAQVRLAAVRVLARAVNAAGEVEALLADVAEHDQDPKVREAASQALSKPKAPVQR